MKNYLLAAGLMGCSFGAWAQPTAVATGCYQVQLQKPEQVIWGLGVEIQNDAIGSGNVGLPDNGPAVPHDLLLAERRRFYHDMLKGFRYCRLAMGLYFRGLDAEQQHVVARYPTQLRDLQELMTESGMEGLSVEYWSPAPAWKSTNSYIGGTLKSTEPGFLNAFGDALVQDAQYLQKAGFTVSMWNLQNEALNKSLGAQSYSHCTYSPEQYYQAFRAVAPKIRAALPKTIIMADTWDGPVGAAASLLRQDAQALANVDAWVMHRIGDDANLPMEQREKMMAQLDGKPLFTNEFEYQWFQKSHFTEGQFMVNTAQTIMNWFTFENSPTWFWLHALKPTCNVEAQGYSLGFWRPNADSACNKFGNIEAGHWGYNNQNYNAIAGFLKYMPWNSRRYQVQEDEVRKDNRILAFKTPAGKLVLVLTNRSGHPFTYQIKTGSRKAFAGYRYTLAERNTPLRRQQGSSLKPTLPDLSIEFWLEQ